MSQKTQAEQPERSQPPKMLREQAEEMALIDLTATKHAQQQLRESEERFRRLTEAVTDYIYRVRVESGWAVETIHGANCEAVTGYTPQEFVDNPMLWIAMVPPEDRSIVERQAARILSGQDDSAIEHRIRRKDGQLCWVLNTVSPHHDDQGQLIAYDGLLRDITERKRAEEALRRLNEELEQRVDARTADLRRRTDQLAHQSAELQESEERFRQLAENVDQIFWLTDPDKQQMLYVNPAFERIFGRTCKSLYENPRLFIDAAHPDDRQRLIDSLPWQRDGDYAIEFRIVRPDGDVRWIRTRAAPVRGADGQVVRIAGISEDVTKEKLAKEALRRAYEFHENLFNTAQTAVLVLDTAGRIVRFNPYLEELTGWRLEEVQGRDWFDTFLPDRHREQIRSRFGQALGGARTQGNVNAIVTRDGRERDIEWYDAPLTSAEGELIGLLCTGQDITERKAAAQALRDSDERMRAILNTAGEAIITIDRHGIVNSANPATQQMFGYTQEELVGRNVKILMPPPYCDEHDGYIAHYLETGEARIIGIGREVVGRHKDGSMFPIGLAVSEVVPLNMFTGIIRNMSAVKELQKQVLEIAAEEDRKIGHELHDNIQQQLTGLGLLAKSVAERLEAAREAESRLFEEAGILETADMATRVADGINQTSQQVHLLSRGLVPVDVDAEGLRAALADLASRVGQQYGVQSEFKCEGVVGVSDNFVATHLYRIAQEAVNNAVKHGRAKRIETSLTSVNDNITLKVLDNGIGIGDTRSAGPGMGLRIMEYRAGLIGATLRIEPRGESGTQVNCTVLRGGGVIYNE